jgi:hypothetical protein
MENKAQSSLHPERSNTERKEGNETKMLFPCYGIFSAI